MLSQTADELLAAIQKGSLALLEDLLVTSGEQISACYSRNYGIFEGENIG